MGKKGKQIRKEAHENLKNANKQDTKAYVDRIWYLKNNLEGYYNDNHQFVKVVCVFKNEFTLRKTELWIGDIYFPNNNKGTEVPRRQWWPVYIQKGGMRADIFEKKYLNVSKKQQTAMVKVNTKHEQQLKSLDQKFIDDSVKLIADTYYQPQGFNLDKSLAWDPFVYPPSGKKKRSSEQRDYHHIKRKPQVDNTTEWLDVVDVPVPLPILKLQSVKSPEVSVGKVTETNSDNLLKSEDPLQSRMAKQILIRETIDLT